jgi:hypothetical protein
VAGASTDDIYAAMDWLEDRQDAIEAELARRHLAAEPNPGRMALFDLSSSWLEGSHCPLAARGYSRDGKKGTLQISTGCSPTRPAARSRSGSSPATPATRPRSPRSVPRRGTGDGRRGCAAGALITRPCDPRRFGVEPGCAVLRVGPADHQRSDVRHEHERLGALARGCWQRADRPGMKMSGYQPTSTGGTGGSPGPTDPSAPSVPVNPAPPADPGEPDPDPVDP